MVNDVRKRTKFRHAKTAAKNAAFMGYEGTGRLRWILFDMEGHAM